MSSVNEQLVPPPKPRMSPLDFRNTDLVSRLLAATPPYLYNMSLLPNTYFFSEMLRSFVQAKADPASRPLPGTLHTRRPRKRTWTSIKNDSYQKAASPKPEPDWTLKSPYSEPKMPERPLELTTKLDEPDSKSSSSKTSTSGFSANLTDKKPEFSLHDPIFPCLGQEANTSGLILPPPPPMWYPPLYPTAPYGIDPLHFFIDLRVSGHIYDRKNQRDQMDIETQSKADEVVVNREEPTVKDMFKPSRHASAFSVPTPHKGPINLSHSEETFESNTMKFDVKSMGFEKQSNKTGTNYIMSNIGSIYKNAQILKQEESLESTAGNDNETEEERQKRARDLRALIGLELVVDYMNHAKPQPHRIPEESSSTDMESIGSPALEVVALHDET